MIPSRYSPADATQTASSPSAAPGATVTGAGARESRNKPWQRYGGAKGTESQVTAVNSEKETKEVVLKEEVVDVGGLLLVGRGEEEGKEMVEGSFSIEVNPLSLT